MKVVRYFLPIGRIAIILSTLKLIAFLVVRIAIDRRNKNDLIVLVM